MNIYYFLATLTGLSTIIIWLGKFIITKTVDIGIEKYRAELTKDIENHKADLSKISLEHEVRFSKLHEQRAEKIKILYDKVREMEKSLKHSTEAFQKIIWNDGFDDSEKDRAADDQIESLTDLADTERIYFSDLTITKIDSVIEKSKETMKAMREVRSFYKEYDELVKSGTPVPQKYLDDLNKWKSVEERIDIELKDLKLELTNEFKKLLGISNN